MNELPQKKVNILLAGKVLQLTASLPFLQFIITQKKFPL